MNVTQFLKAVVPSDGVLILAENAQRWQHRAYDDHDEAVGFITDRRGQADIYYAMASFKKKKVRDKGGNYKISRTDDNVKSLQALWLDIDAGDGKSYATKRAAAEALVEFVKAAKLPAWTLLVDSGNGLHVYWTFDEPVSKNDWKPVAQALKAACAQHGLRADPVATADTARVLRPIGSLNHKDPTNLKPVKLKGKVGVQHSFAALRRALEPYTRVTAKPSAAASVNDDLSGGMGTGKAAPRHMRYAVENCQQLARVLANGGAEADEPFWKDTLLAAAFCEDGHEYAHKLSEGHQGYSEGDTEAKFQQQLEKVEAGSVGWPKCETFESHCPGQCDGCPLQGQGKTPLHLAVEMGKTDDGVSVPFPRGWRLDNDGRLWKRIDPEDDDGDEAWVPVSDHQLLEISLVEMPDGSDGVEFRIGHGLHEGQTQSLACSLVNDQRTINSRLGGTGVFGDYVTPWRKFMSGYIANLQAQKGRRAEAIRQFGWRNDGTEFVVGPNVYTKSGPQPVGKVVGGAHFTKNFTPSGDYETWKKAADHIIQFENQRDGRRARTTMLASAFAAPLMWHYEIEGVCLSMVGGTGVGKSAAMEVAQAVWGSKLAMQQLNDTANSINANMGWLNNLPVYWDEAQSMGATSDRDMADLMMRLTQGRNKGRLTAEASQRDTLPWSTMLATTSNYSLFDAMQARKTGAEAGFMRVFELEVEPLPRGSGNNPTLLAVKRNYGHAGAIYADWLVRHPEEVKAIRAKVHEAINKQLAETEAKFRYWQVAIETLVAGAYMANKAGITTFDIRGLTQYLLAQYRRNQSKVWEHKREDGAISYVRKYINAKQGETLLSDFVPTNFSKGTPIIKDNPPRRVMEVHRGDDGWYRISVHCFEEWLRDDMGIGSQTKPLLQDIVETGIFKNPYNRKPVTLRNMKGPLNRVIQGVGRFYRRGPRKCWDVHEDDLEA